MSTATRPPLTDRAREIVDAVLRVYGFDESELFSRSKVHLVSEARQVVWLLIRDRLRWPYDELARVFDRDHNTVIHGVTRVRRRQLVDTELVGDIARARRLIESAEHQREGPAA